MAKRQITLNEEKLREFISYSVARLLKEAYGKPIYDRHGEYDGYEDTKYGSDSFVFEPDIDKYLSDEVDFPEYPKVKVYFTRTEGMKGDGYMQPDDPDEYKLDSWEIVNQEGMTPEVMNAVKQYMENDFDVEEAANEHGNLYEENRGVMAHFSGEGFQPKNPYENMTWDEYCAAKAREREEDAEKKRLHDMNYPEDGKENRGITTHFDGEKHEKTPEEIEADEHMFDDDYWANREKIHVSKDEISEMIQNQIKQLKEGLGQEEGEVQSQFPRQASRGFTMKYYGGKDVRCKVFVTNDEDEVVITVFQYDPRSPETNKWAPQFEWAFNIEGYTNGTWLPYWETLGGDTSMRTLARIWPTISKALVKIGYLADEDDEVPFRYQGDIKGF
jgi:hypothetical protein